MATLMADIDNGTFAATVNEMSKYRLVSIYCPVDVEVIDQTTGVRVTEIKDNKVIVSNEDVEALVVGDSKFLRFDLEKNYKINLTATDNGDLTYMIEDQIYTENGEYAPTAIRFDDIALTPGKIMTGEVFGDQPADEQKLFVVDHTGEKTKEILENGQEILYTEPDQNLKPEETGSPQNTGTPKETDSPQKTETPRETRSPQKTEPSEAINASQGTYSSNGPFIGSRTKSSVKVKKINISGLSKKIAAGKKIKLKATVTPPNVADKTVVWKSSNKKYAVVNNKGIVTLKKAGKGKTVKISATAKDGNGITAVYKIKIMKGVVKKIQIDGKPVLTVNVGKSIKLKVSVKASDGANKNLRWRSSNMKYATVDSKGKVVLKKQGKGKNIKIIAMATDGSGKKAIVKIKIR